MNGGGCCCCNGGCWCWAPLKAGGGPCLEESDPCVS